MFSTNRRTFLSTGGATLLGGAAAGLGDLGFIGKLPRAAGAEFNADTDADGMVPLRPEIEPLVRLLEETPREKLLEVVANRIHQGLTYREILAALFLAGVRNIQPRPAVGFKFHGVLVVNSAHLASLNSPDEHRWLPMFWALDYFKQTQAQDVREGDWHMRPVNESSVPHAEKAVKAFTSAMDSWDEEAADVAAAGLARAAGANEICELFYRYGARDFRSIGHKAIYVANGFRTLQTIGWEHAEPIVRSLAYALQNRRGEPNPAENDLPADAPWRRNQQLVGKFRPDWVAGRRDPQATRDLLVAFRTANHADICDQILQVSNDGYHPQVMWDAVFVAAAELLMRQRGIVALHALTTANALRYAFDWAKDENTRKLMLLQAAAFMTMFREAMRDRGRVGEVDITALQPEAVTAQGGEAVTEIFANLAGDRMAAARKTLTVLQDQRPEALVEAARVLVFLKGNDAHDYKFSSAVLEDCYHVSPPWRNAYLAASVFNLHGADERDNALVQRIRSALEA